MTYEYKCSKCGNIVEEMRYFAHRDDIVTCKCGTNMKRIEISKPNNGSKRSHMWTPNKIR